MTVRPADENVEAVRAALDQLPHDPGLFDQRFRNDALDALASLSARLSAAETGQAAAERERDDLARRLRDEEMENGQFQRAYEDEKADRAAAEQRAADAEKALLRADATCGEMHTRAVTAEQDLALVARWLEDEMGAGLQIPVPVLAALAFSPAVLNDESRDALASARAGEATERATSYACHPTHYCITCGSKDGPGPGCGNCRQTGYDQTPCQLCPAGEATEERT